MRGSNICWNYRRLNAIDEPDNILRYIHDLNYKMYGNMIFRRSYLQIPLETSNFPKTAVITWIGFFEFINTHYGIPNAKKTFQYYIDDTVKGTKFHPYLHDILVVSIDLEMHLRDQDTIFWSRMKDNWYLM